MATLKFLGATGTVTGSKYLLESEGERLLIDCGLFQGAKEWRVRNWEPLRVPPPSLSWVVLTHAHLDHVGYISRLVKDGFREQVLNRRPGRAMRCRRPRSGWAREGSPRGEVLISRRFRAWPECRK